MWNTVAVPGKEKRPCIKVVIQGDLTSPSMECKISKHAIVWKIFKLVSTSGHSVSVLFSSSAI
jgi:hypothetical protein